MAFTHRGGFAVLFAILTIGVCVVALLPKVFWVEAEVKLSDDFKVQIKSSLWQQCNTTTIGNYSATECSGIRKIDFNKIKSEPSAERDGAVAGLVLGGFFALASLFGVCCRSKCATVSLLVVSLIFTAATVGCYFRYKDHSLSSEYDFIYGYWVACVACGLALFSVIGSCCMNKNAEYEILA
ncbi:hypothetical protein PTSG_03061 [Salpingoeca rosetta]|uniref:Claudin n=1 Tax=Salpingoeca rosetta (strain ATCC 50818 / BSB-021) TaxID=946362 RepID=F2U452_SALR5|nr:uncharacterized protein PTSG_03061 [Salpingoeca rosetta]EGD82418.1 hypothetical protein PTSG_03061 [Salpingoeca rosetta]|eukprot:XP_004995654.1 hypothetical protein PTSG_03061 [Salpingoeca rosetta]